MKVLVTGANGFLGAKLVRRLAEAGFEVRAMMRRTQGSELAGLPGVEPWAGEISKEADVRAALQGVEQVYHLAAISTDWAADPRDFYRINVEAGLQLFRLCREAGVKRILVTSTAGTIGPPDPDDTQAVDEDHIRRVRFFTDYECSKIILEERIQYLVRQGMDIVVVNPTRVYGPGPIERKNAYLILIRSYLHRAFAPYPAFKRQLANMAFVDDVVEGHLLAMARGRAGERYLLGGPNVTFDDLFATLTKLTGKKGRPIAIPLGLFAFGASVAKLRTRLFKKAPMVTHAWIEKTRYSCPVSSEKAIRELGYAPHSYEDALRKTVAYIDAEVKAGRA